MSGEILALNLQISMSKAKQNLKDLKMKQKSLTKVKQKTDSSLTHIIGNSFCIIDLIFTSNSNQTGRLSFV